MPLDEPLDEPPLLLELPLLLLPPELDPDPEELPLLEVPLLELEPPLLLLAPSVPASLAAVREPPQPVIAAAPVTSPPPTARTTLAHVADVIFISRASEKGRPIGPAVADIIPRTAPPRRCLMVA